MQGVTLDRRVFVIAISRGSLRHVFRRRAGVFSLVGSGYRTLRRSVSCDGCVRQRPTRSRLFGSRAWCRRLCTRIIPIRFLYGRMGAVPLDAARGRFRSSVTTTLLSPTNNCAHGKSYCSPGLKLFISALVHFIRGARPGR